MTCPSCNAMTGRPNRLCPRCADFVDVELSLDAARRTLALLVERGAADLALDVVRALVHDLTARRDAMEPPAAADEEAA